MQLFDTKFRRSCWRMLCLKALREDKLLVSLFNLLHNLGPKNLNECFLQVTVSITGIVNSLFLKVVMRVRTFKKIRTIFWTQFVFSFKHDAYFAVLAVFPTLEVVGMKIVCQNIQNTFQLSCVTCTAKVPNCMAICEMGKDC